jgi:magnesium transporter
VPLRYARPTVITCRVYQGGSLQKEAPYDRLAIGRAREAGDHRVWIDVIDPTDAELTELQAEFGLHELSIEDSRRWGQRSKVEFYPDYLFLTAHGLSLDDQDELVDSEIHLFAGKGFYLITIRREPLFQFETAVQRLGRDQKLMGEGIGFLLYLLTDEVVDGYLDAVERLEDLSDDLEDRVFSEAGDADVQEDIFKLKRKVVKFRRLAIPMREVIDLMQEYPGLVTPELVPYFRDVQDHVIRAIEFIDNIRDLLTSALESQLAQVSNRLNVVMKQLSAWAGIILVPTLIAGIYGMNFRNMPELTWQIGYPFAIGLMLVSAGMLYRVFKKREWL